MKYAMIGDRFGWHLENPARFFWRHHAARKPTRRELRTLTRFHLECHSRRTWFAIQRRMARRGLFWTQVGYVDAGKLEYYGELTVIPLQIIPVQR